MNSINFYETKFQTIKTQKLPRNVVIDELGNTISANDYRREKASFLATEVSRIAWSPSSLQRARNLIASARRYSQA